MNEELSIKQLVLDVANLIAMIACNYFAASVVLAAISGVLGVLIAFCAALGASHVYIVVGDKVGSAASHGYKYITHRFDQYLARRRNDTFFSVIDC